MIDTNLYYQLLNKRGIKYFINIFKMKRNHLSELSLLIILIGIISNIPLVRSAHTAFCINVAGYSVGASHFCKDCDKWHRGGLGVYATAGAWNKADNKSALDPELVDIKVTSIMVENKILNGWFHISIKLKKPIYTFLIQIEDDDTNLVVGEFTTELMNYCKENDKTITPTQSQLLPCQYTGANNVMNGNAVAYFREADVPDIIRTKDLNEFHVNWKIPSTYSCSFTRVFFIRVDVLSLPPGLSPSCDNGKPRPKCSNEPAIHTSNRVRIHLPHFHISNQFNGPDPMPKFFDPGSVTCHNPIKSTSNTPDLPFIEEIDNDKIECDKQHIKPEPKICRQVPPLIICLTPNGSIVEKATSPTYVGRCPIKDRPSVSSTIMCKQIKDTSDKTSIDALPTLNKYIENLQYDLCNCYKDLLANEPNGGSLNIIEQTVKAHQGTLSNTAKNIQPIKNSSADVKFHSSKPESKLSNSKNVSEGETLKKTLVEMGRKCRFMHGMFSAIIFLFIVPVSTFATRYFKETFHGPLCILGVWYTAHVGGIMLTFSFLVFSYVMLIAGKIWTEDLDISLNHQFSAAFYHGYIGWVVIVLYVFLVITGGFRPYNPNSNRSLKIAIALHAITGMVFYFLGLISIIVYFQRTGSPFTLIMIWIIIDAIFHFIMTLHMIKVDTELGLDRSYFPAMERVFTHRLAPGVCSRLIIFGIYVMVTIIITYNFIGLIHVEDLGLNENLTTFMLKNITPAERNNRY